METPSRPAGWREKLAPQPGGCPALLVCLFLLRCPPCGVCISSVPLGWGRACLCIDSRAQETACRAELPPWGNVAPQQAPASPLLGPPLRSLAWVQGSAEPSQTRPLALTAVQGEPAAPCGLHACAVASAAALCHSGARWQEGAGAQVCVCTKCSDEKTGTR